MKDDLKLGDEQREILFGILLGDACLETQNRGRTYRLKIEQSARHREYVFHLYEVFHSWVLTPPRLRLARASNGTKTESWVFSTVSHASFRFFAQQFYAKGRKHIPRLIQRWLTPRGLAYWFMDDGSMKSGQSKGVLFNTQGFIPADVVRLTQVLQQCYGLKATTRRQKDGTQIFVSGDSFEKLGDLIGGHLHPTMRYKFPTARRTRLPKR